MERWILDQNRQSDGEKMIDQYSLPVLIEHLLGRVDGAGTNKKKIDGHQTGFTISIAAGLHCFFQIDLFLLVRDKEAVLAFSLLIDSEERRRLLLDSIAVI